MEYGWVNDDVDTMDWWKRKDMHIALRVKQGYNTDEGRI